MWSAVTEYNLMEIERKSKRQREREEEGEVEDTFPVS